MATQQMLASIIANRAREVMKKTDNNLGMPHSPGATNKSIREGRDLNDNYEEENAMFSAEYDPAYHSDNGSRPSYTSTITEEDIERSSLPKNILESFKQKQIDRGSIEGTGGGSVIDSLGIKTPPLKKQITEEKSAYKGTDGIDYTIIKAIVNECLSSYLGGNKQKDNTLKTIGIKKGVITLVDNSGNVFKAKLEKVGNKKEIGD